MTVVGGSAVGTLGGATLLEFNLGVTLRNGTLDGDHPLRAPWNK
jgi:hypothetical protein